MKFTDPNAVEAQLHVLLAGSASLRPASPSIGLTRRCSQSVETACKRYAMTSRTDSLGSEQLW